MKRLNGTVAEHQKPSEITGNTQLLQDYVNGTSKQEIQQDSHAQGRTIFRSLSELMDIAANSPDLRKLLGNYILENSMTLLIGERASSKTYLAMQIGLAVSQGMPRFLGETIEIHGTVLYLNFELSEKQIALRLQRLINMGLPYPLRSNDSFHVCSVRGKLDEELLDEIGKQIEEHHPVLIIIDNFRAAFSDVRADDNSAVARSLLNLANLKDEHNTTILIIHHTKKGTSELATHSDLQSGGGALSDFADADFFIRKSKQSKFQRILKRGKSREVEEADGAKLIEFCTTPGNLWFVEIEDNIDEKEHLGEGVARRQRSVNVVDFPLVFAGKKELSSKELLEKLGTMYNFRGGTAQRIVDDALSTNKLCKPKRGKYLLASEDEIPDTG